MRKKILWHVIKQLVCYTQSLAGTSWSHTHHLEKEKQNTDYYGDNDDEDNQYDDDGINHNDDNNDSDDNNSNDDLNVRLLCGMCFKLAYEAILCDF